MKDNKEHISINRKAPPTREVLSVLWLAPTDGETCEAVCWLIWDSLTCSALKTYTSHWSTCPNYVRFISTFSNTICLQLYQTRDTCPDVKNYKWWLNPVWHRMLYSCTHMAVVGVKGITARNMAVHQQPSVWTVTIYYNCVDYICPNKSLTIQSQPLTPTNTRRSRCSYDSKN